MNKENLRINPFAKYIRISLAGFAMGVANVIPGVSGGTMAFILNIYEELIDSVRKFASVDVFKKVFTGKFKILYNTLPWPFLTALGVGVVVAFASAAKLFTRLLESHPELTFAFFFGLVAASVLTVLKKVTKWSFGRLIMLILGAITAYLMVTLVPVETPDTWWMCFFGGMLVICAMILPGVSGSFLLLILGQYKNIWGAVASLASGNITTAALSTVFWLGAGCVIGLGAFVHLLNWLLKRFHDLTVATLIGFMAGSLWKLWPWKQVTMYAIKMDDKVMPNLDMTNVASVARLEFYKSGGASVKPLIENNLFPSNCDAAFWGAVGLAVAGFIIVLATEYIAAKRGSNKLEG